MEKGFYPKGLERENGMELPDGKNFGKIKIDSVMAYGNKEVIISPIGNEPTMYIDLESPIKTHKVMNKLLIHLGFSTKYNINENRGSPKPRIDIYLLPSELDILINILQEIKDEMEKSNSSV